MSQSNKLFRLTLLSAALAAVFGVAHADDDAVKELTRPESSISAGLGNWSGDRHQMGIYDGMPDARFYGLIDADIVRRDDETGTWLKFKAINLGLDTRELRGEYLRQGDFGAFLEYNRIVRDNPNTFTTRLNGIGSTTQTVSVNNRLGPLQTVKLGTERDIVGLGLYKNLASGLDFNLTFKNEEKSGTRQWGRGGQPEFAVEPIDSVTRQVKGTLSYSSKSFQLSGGYSGSWYDNKNSLVAMTNAGLPVNNTNTTYLSLPLDNEAHQLFLNGGYTFSPTTRATMKLSYTRALQNANLPTKDIPGLSFAGSPSSLEGRVNTTLMQFGLTSRPIQDLSLVANLRYHNVDDETPVRRFVQTNAACASGQCVDNTPLSYKTITGKLEGTYRLPAGFSVTGGVEERRQDRTVPVANSNGAAGTDTQRVVPMRAEVDETTWRLELRRSLSDTVNGSVAYLFSQRSGSTYVSANAGPGGNASDSINPLNIADRDRNKVRVAVDWAPMDNLSFQFNIEDARDKYDHNSARPYGLTEGSALIYGFDANYTLSDKWRVNAWYSYDQNQAKQLNSRTIATGSIKDNNLEDTGNSVGLGLRGVVTSRISLGADVLWTRNVSKYDQTLNAAQTAGLDGNLPSIENKLTRLSLFSTYAIDKNSDVRLDLINEQWKTNDWSWMFANGTAFSYGATGAAGTDGTTVTADPKQSSTFVGLRYIYKFQ